MCKHARDNDNNNNNIIISKSIHEEKERNKKKYCENDVDYKIHKRYENKKRKNTK